VNSIEKEMVTDKQKFGKDKEIGPCAGTQEAKGNNHMAIL